MMKCSSCGAETRINHGSSGAVLCESCFDTELANSRASFEKQEPNTNSGKMSSDYKTSIEVAKIISGIGWFIAGIAVLVVLVSFGNMGNMGILALGPGLNAFMGGLVIVVAGQATRALLENANSTRQILELLMSNNASSGD